MALYRPQTPDPRPQSTALELQKVERILLLKPSSLGDVIHAMPTASAIKRRYPEKHLSWVVEEESAPVIQESLCLDDVLVLPRKRWQRDLLDPSRIGSTLREAGVFLRELRERRYDLAIDLQGLLKSGFLALASGARFRVGLEGSREGSYLFMTHRVPIADGPEHAVDRYLRVATYLGADGEKKEFPIRWSIKEEERVEAFLHGSSRPRIVLHPAARWKTKLWDTGRFAALGDMLVNRLGASLLITGGPEDLPLVKGIAEGMRSRAFILAGRTSLKELAALLVRGDLMITLDSGPMHLGAALGTPVIALFGPTDPQRTGPYGEGHQVIRREIPCSPCFRRRCPIPDEGACMKSISVEEVFERVFEVLRRKG